MDGLDFVGYQFSWLLWRVRSTNSSTHEMVIFCMNYERKYYGHEFEPLECAIFVQSTKIGTHENKHSVSIAKAIQVPYRPQQIFKRHNSYNSRLKGPKSIFKSIKQNMTEKSLGNIFAKGINSFKSRSSMTKLELDLYRVRSNSYTKF